MLTKLTELNYTQLIVFNISIFLIFNTLIVRKKENYLLLVMNRFFCVLIHATKSNFYVPVHYKLSGLNRMICQLVNTYYWYFRALNFTGKSYKMLFEKTYINLQFNKANINYLVTKNSVIIKQVGKQKLFLKTFSSQTMFQTLRMIWLVRPQNIFTGRGLKASGSLIFKKKGKVSTYSTQSSQF